MKPPDTHGNVLPYGEAMRHESWPGDYSATMRTWMGEVMKQSEDDRVLAEAFDAAQAALGTEDEAVAVAHYLKVRADWREKQNQEN
jgi:hypothetical protein